MLHLHPLVVIMLFDMKYYCDLNGMRYEITSTVSTHEEDKALGRKSSTHRTGRAADLSVRGWSQEDTTSFINYFTEKYNHLGAYSGGTNKVIVHHNSGHGDHIHVQINYRYKLPVKSEEELR